MEARPGPWAGSDFTYKNVLSIAGGYDGCAVDAYLAPGFTAGALENFVKPIREGVLVVGHNAVKYDLPFLSGTLVKFGLEPLPELMVSDTMRHIPKNGYSYSRGLGDMCKRFGIGEAKGSMSAFDWEQAYDGIPAALDRLRIYNMADVHATLALRRKLLDRGLLSPPKVWRP